MTIISINFSHDKNLKESDSDDIQVTALRLAAGRRGAASNLKLTQPEFVVKVTVLLSRLTPTWLLITAEPESLLRDSSWNCLNLSS